MCSIRCAMPQVPKCGFAMSARLSCRFWFPIVTDIWRMWRWVTKDFRSYFGDPALCGKSIGRVAGCIAYGTMRIDGEEYRLDINGMAGHLNGGVKASPGACGRAVSKPTGS